MSTSSATARRPPSSSRRSRRWSPTIPLAKERPIHIMEVCGGHTHSIFRYGIEGMLPKEIELVHGPGCPVCVLPMGRVDDCVSIAERPERDLHHLRRRHARAGLEEEPAAGQGRRRRHPHGLFADGRARHRPQEPRSRGGVLRPRLRDHHAVDGAHRAAGRSRRHHQFLGVLQPHHHRADASRRSSTAPTCISTASSGQAMCRW